MKFAYMAALLALGVQAWPHAFPPQVSSRKTNRDISLLKSTDATSTQPALNQVLNPPISRPHHPKEPNNRLSPRPEILGASGLGISYFCFARHVIANVPKRVPRLPRVPDLNLSQVPTNNKDMKKKCAEKIRDFMKNNINDPLLAEQVAKQDFFKELCYLLSREPANKKNKSLRIIAWEFLDNRRPNNEIEIKHYHNVAKVLNKIQEKRSDYVNTNEQTHQRGGVLHCSSMFDQQPPLSRETIEEELVKTLGSNSTTLWLDDQFISSELEALSGKQLHLVASLTKHVDLSIVSKILADKPFLDQILKTNSTIKLDGIGSMAGMFSDQQKQYNFIKQMLSNPNFNNVIEIIDRNITTLDVLANINKDSNDREHDKANVLTFSKAPKNTQETFLRQIKEQIEKYIQPNKQNIDLIEDFVRNRIKANPSEDVPEEVVETTAYLCGKRDLV